MAKYKICLRFLNYLVKVSDTSQSLTETESPLNISITSPMAFAAEAHRAEGELQRLTLRLLMSYIYGAPSKARNANVVYIWTYVWQR